MVWGMDWQQPVALLLVATTVWLWLRALLRRRGAVAPGKRSKGWGCGCPAASGSPGGERMIYRARKGERPELVVRLGGGRGE